MEAFLLSIRSDYENMALDDVVIKYMAATGEVASTDSVKKCKMRLVKYGLWEAGKIRLDDIEKAMMDMGLNRILELKPRNVHQSIAVKHKSTEASVRSKYAFMKRYGLLK